MAKSLVNLDDGTMMMMKMKMKKMKKKTMMIMTTMTTTGERGEGDTVNPKTGRGRRTTMETRATRKETGGV